MEKLIILLFIVLLFIGCANEGNNNIITEIEPDTLSICSFNIQFLGSSTKRDDHALADILKGYDIVVIQELVSPPYTGVFADSSDFKPDAESAEFFDEMKNNGFQYVLSEEDTGTGDRNHLNSSATEWWVTFYKPGKVNVADNLPNGFLAEDRTNHDDFERVPYAFGFRTINDSIDFVLISVHLKPGKYEHSRRKEELTAIGEWIDDNNEDEKDFIILGDMNIYNYEELMNVIPDGFVSLNDECRRTNTSATPQPYDHVMYIPEYTSEIDSLFDMKVIDLIEAMRGYWNTEDGVYPGDPYVHNTFRQYYSDHHPVEFRMVMSEDED
ncbi:MAG: endonuclease/exonuclease/phosphatase family protein [Candidatus Cloacimonetes bacterium]|nr:endonuclease/exonuclease/phosphatase family protein [Candidatus Cloacimonadota bacterium]